METTRHYTPLVRTAHPVQRDLGMTKQRTTAKAKPRVIKSKTSKVEGEGSRTADRRYRKGVQTFLKTANPTAIARRAAKELSEEEPVAKRKPVQRPGFLRTVAQQVRNSIGSVFVLIKRLRETRTRLASR